MCLKVVFSAMSAQQNIFPQFTSLVLSWRMGLLDPSPVEACGFWIGGKEGEDMDVPTDPVVYPCHT